MNVSRRSVLGVLGVGALGGLAGCTMLDQTVSLRQLVLANEADDERAVNLLVEADGTLVHWATETVPPADGTVPGTVQIGCTWPVDVPSYRLSTRLDGESEWESWEIDATAVHDDGELCRRITIDEDGEISEQSITPCPSDPSGLEAIEFTCDDRSAR
ncbi:hypothetical protein [Natrialba sp. INN-245]|uniref:hypothetical protein n=1 Tax=Natrialba sp. INN-245 TaxID=2690967 RepID=UPI001311F511|nr:hypothetical protein [Natrialba sp. INN-245]MWV38787.1 hypothetical protein [Natrialba sp. INN-245]